MKLLLDTHALLWFIAGDSRTSAAARALIEDRDNEKLVSIASLWEIAIKTSTGKLVFDEPLSGFVQREIINAGFRLLMADVEHVLAVATLPYHHRDPFDRLLITQAIVEQIPVVTNDVAFGQYPVQLLW